MKRLALVLVLVTMVMATLGSSLAAADPLNSPQADTVTLTCSNGRAYQIEVVRAGGLPQLHIVGSTGNFILAEITFTAIDPDTGEILFSGTESVGQGNKTGLQGELITCTVDPEMSVDPATGETFTFVVSAEGFLTPRGR